MMAIFDESAAPAPLRPIVRQVARVLWLSAEEPNQNLSGGSIRCAHLLEALARRTETHVITLGPLRDLLTREHLASVTELSPIPARPTRSRTLRRVEDLRRALLTREPSEIIDGASARTAFARVIGQASGFDVVCVEHHGLAPLLPVHRSNRWTLTLHNLPSHVAAQAASVAPAGRQRFLLRREQAKAARRELWAVRSYDLVFTVSDEDAAGVPGPTVVVPNGVDIRRFHPTPLPDAPRLVLTAMLSYQPNVDGARWFCNEVLPLVTAQVPDVTLDLVGRQPVAEVQSLANRPGIRLRADVPDVLPWLQSARVAVVPLRIGSGTRLKALEAMAAGRPVVGTSIGLAGLGLVPGRHAVVADDAETMAGGIVSLLLEDEGARRLAAAGRALVKARFSWDRVSAIYLDALLGTNQPATSR